MLDDLPGRLDVLDAKFDGAKFDGAKFDGAVVASTLDALLADGHGALPRDRTDALIGLVGAQLVELVAGPTLSPGAETHPSGHRRRDGRRQECEACFDEGYALGRILLDTDQLALIHSPMAADDGAAGFARLRVLRRLILREETSEAFVRTRHVAAFVRIRADQRRPARNATAIDPELAAQLIGLGTMTAICEWSMLLGDDNPSAEVLRLR